MINEVTDGIILLVMSSVIFNLWPDDRPSSPPSLFFLLPYVFFLQQTTTPYSQHNSTSHNKFGHHNTQFVSIRVLIQILLRILHFKQANIPLFYYYYLNSILKCWFFCIFFVVYVFCLGAYLFYSFFSYKFVVWIYDLYMLGFVLDFVKLY